MSFADEMRKMKSSELTDRERNEILKKETLENNENDILEVSNWGRDGFKYDLKMYL